MNHTSDIVIIGSGLGALTAACLLAKKGLKPLVLEQNYLPGGCTSSYWRKGFIFESGATTVVGLEKYMPLGYLLDQTGIRLNALPLKLPMKVHLQNGQVIHKYQHKEAWITEATRVFGAKNQEKFWKFCYTISDFVWKTSLKQRIFPPRSFSDWLYCLRHIDWPQLRFSRYAFSSMRWLLMKFGLLENSTFVDYINEQLLITAQNQIDQVNVLFGATALCYTNYTNYYIQGGLINLIHPLINYLEERGGTVQLRERVTQVERKATGYAIHTPKKTYRAAFLLSGIPINNTLQIYKNDYHKKYRTKLLHSPQLNSAFQMGIGFKTTDTSRFDSIHHQIHLPVPLPDIHSKSIFVSFNHPHDLSRCDVSNQMVASVSTHLPDPQHVQIQDKTVLENIVLEQLEEKGFLRREEVVYQHSSTQQSWQKWTGREFGFVGGYPQYLKTKPWQMLGARLDGHKAYLCGDTVYPGQGIPGTALSGIIAYEKLKKDWL